MEIITCTFDKQEEPIRSVRYTVFIEEQSVPSEMEFDDRDPVCIHVVAIEKNIPIGTGRIDIEKSGKIGRVAVLRSRRGKGVGKEIMLTLEKIAKDNAVSSVWCHAQESAIPFYEKLEYQTKGDKFIEAGIVHQIMTKELDCEMAV